MITTVSLREPLSLQEVCGGSNDGMFVVKFKMVALYRERKSTDNSLLGDRSSLREVQHRRYLCRSGHQDCSLCQNFDHVAIGWHLQLRIDSRPWDVHMFTAKMSSRKSRSEDYHSSLRTVWQDTGTAAGLHRCNNWRITPHQWLNFNQKHVWGSSQWCIRITGTSRMIVKQIVVGRRLNILDCRSARRFDNHTAKKGFKLPL